MTPTILALLMLSVGGLLFCVSALESALSALQEHRIATITEGDKALAAKLRKLLEVKESRLGQVLVLSALCNTCMAALGLFLVRKLAPQAELTPLALGSIIFGVLVVVCHLLPNLVASLRPHFIFGRVAPPVLFLANIVMPFELRLHAMASWITNLLTPSHLQPNRSLLDDELETLVEMRRDEGAFEDLEGEVIHEILKLGDKTAKDCMTPRVDCVALPLDLPPNEAERRIREQTHRRIPVYDGTLDKIIGVLDVAAFLQSGSPGFQRFLQAPTFVPETLGAIQLFERHLSHADSLSIVLDEFGGFEGVVTRADIIEDLVEDVAPAEEPEIQELGNGRFLVSGSARLEELCELTRLDLETEGLDTIGGLVATQLGRIPLPGETINLESIQAIVRKSTAKRIEELLLITTTADDPPDDQREDQHGGTT